MQSFLLLKWCVKAFIPPNIKKKLSAHLATGFNLTLFKFLRTSAMVGGRFSSHVWFVDVGLRSDFKQPAEAF